jgi:protein-S-isoprenylcysteine O-methyltransferase Ste14
VVSGFPASLDRAFISAIAWLGPIAAWWGIMAFPRSQVDLGRNWSVTLKIRERHVLITTGVYRRIRHPMYTSFFLLGLAQLLLLPNRLAGASGLIGAGLLFAFRVYREERMIMEYFGSQYRSCMLLTKRIIPWVI